MKRALASMTRELASPSWVTKQLMQPRLCRPKFAPFYFSTAQVNNVTSFLAFKSVWTATNIRRVKIVQSGVDVAWDGSYQAVNRRLQPHSQVLSHTRLSLCLSLAPLGRVRENPGDEAADRAQLFEGRLALNPGFSFLCSKAFSPIIFSVIFRTFNHQLIDKKN